jgi:hypothetical protein
VKLFRRKTPQDRTIEALARMAESSTATSVRSPEGGDSMERFQAAEVDHETQAGQSGSTAPAVD